ncbi:MAG: alpha/beta hydrolase, partial [Nitrospinota bacterium]|nr:alpha/beta hydrolase [Nitrospinota bacterium]
MSQADGPHQGQPVLQMGAALEDARAAMLLVHGRGAPPDDLLSLVPHLGQADFAYLALAASQRSWYPYSFLSPIEDNEPGISSGLRAIGEVLAEVEAAGIPAERVMLLGFSQGACLSLEYAA